MTPRAARRVIEFAGARLLICPERRFSAVSSCGGERDYRAQISLFACVAHNALS
jgi:hypothetical protein